MVTWIGLCAGEVWKYLETHEGYCPVEKVINDIDAPEQSVLMAIGWLAREGHILLRGAPPDYRIILNIKKTT
ncbi:MAG: winged helix-turn-helix domain-containing protein [Candidatus Omnitrophota bacterium]|nr:winged helix-turn-helix domain-containing protein [Candidatus Omnitrophota bacterium]